jgi:hypothetical protein
MKLITDELKQRFKEIGNQRDVDDPLVITRFFVQGKGMRWYVTEYCEETNCCYAYITNIPWHDGTLHEEWSTVSIDTLEQMKLPFLLTIERDKGFKETRFDTLKANNFNINYYETDH